MNVSSLLQGLVALLWMLVVGLIILVIVRASRGKSTKVFSTATLIIAVLAVTLTTVSAGLVFIQP